MSHQKEEPPVRSILEARRDQRVGKGVAKGEQARFEMLFGSVVYYDINDISIEHWSYFLDHTRTLDDLLYGLYLLAPFVDDALKVAEAMTEQDFWTFKLCLAHERRVSQNSDMESNLPLRYYALVLPARFLEVLPVTEKCDVDLGVGLMRLYEIREKEK